MLQTAKSPKAAALFADIQTGQWPAVWIVPAGFTTGFHSRPDF